jgi:hypothetical protein
MGVIPMVWFAVQTPVPVSLAWPVSAAGFPVLAFAVAAVLAGLVVYKVLTQEQAYRPALRVVEGGREAGRKGGRSELTLKPA